MGEKKEEDLYRKFSRKDLQGLCKKYGLPAKKSNSEMATSLILYLEKKNRRSRGKSEGTKSNPLASGTTELQIVVRMKSTDDQRKDCGHMASHSGSGDNQCHDHRDSQHNDMLNWKGSASSNKASEEVDILTQLHRENNSGVGIPENTFSSVFSSPVVARSPTFTFDVSCEDGIQLHVDLNSSPADWIESLKAGVHISHDVHKPKSQSFHQDIGLLCCSKPKYGSVTMDPSKETHNGQLEDESYPTTIMTGSQARTDEPNEGERSLSSPGLKSLSNVVPSLENSKEEQANLFSRLKSGSEGQFPGAISSRSEETLAIGSDVNAAIQTKTLCIFTGNSLPSDTKCSEMAVQQNPSACDEIYVESSMQQTSGSLAPVLECSELPTTVCLEMQASSGATKSQDISGVGKCEDVAEQLKSTKVVQHRVVESDQTPSTDELQMWPAQAVDQNKCVSPVFRRLSPVLAEDLSKMDKEHSRAPLSDGQIREAQTSSAENAGCLRAHEAGCRTDELQKEDSSQYPSCNDGSPDLVVPEQNGSDRCILTKSNELKEDNNRNLSTTNVGDLGKSDIRNGNEDSKYLNFENLIEKPWKKPADSESNREKPWKKPADSESNREPKRKRHLNSVEHRSKFVNTEAKILRSSKQFAGDVHSKRRRSSRLFPKAIATPKWYSPSERHV